MQRDMGDHHIEAAGIEIGRFRILLTKVYWHTQRFCASVRVAQNWGGNVDRVHLGVGKCLRPRYGTAADGAAKVEDSLGGEIRPAGSHEP